MTISKKSTKNLKGHSLYTTAEIFERKTEEDKIDINEVIEY